MKRHTIEATISQSAFGPRGNGTYYMRTVRKWSTEKLRHMILSKTAPTRTSFMALVALVARMQSQYGTSGYGLRAASVITGLTDYQLRVYLHSARRFFGSEESGTCIVPE